MANVTLDTTPSSTQALVTPCTLAGWLVRRRCWEMKSCRESFHVCLTFSRLDKMRQRRSLTARNANVHTKTLVGRAVVSLAVVGAGRLVVVALAVVVGREVVVVLGRGVVGLEVVVVVAGRVVVVVVGRAVVVVVGRAVVVVLGRGVVGLEVLWWRAEWWSSSAAQWSLLWSAA